jgi:2-oxoglutarate ferredoxin oxidoreductase subunit alpha
MSAPRRSTWPTGCRRPVFVMTDLDIGMNQRLCKPFAWDDSRAYDRGKVMTAEEARGRQGLRPLQGRRRRRHPLAHLPGHAPDQGRVLHPRHHARPYARYSERGPDYIYNVQRLLRSSRPPPTGAAAGAAPPRPQEDALCVIYFGSTSAGDGRGAGRAGRTGHPPRRAARAAFPFPRAVEPTSSPRTTKSSWSSRTATRRCARCWSTN